MGLVEKIKEVGRNIVLSSILSVQALAQCGDCNGDKLVNINDALISAQYGAGIPTALDFEQCNVSGIYGDESVVGATVDVLDSLKIARSSAGLDDNITCGVERVVFVERTSTKTEIYQIAKNGTNRRQLTNDRTNKGSPVWSSDGEKIAFTDDYGTSNNELVLMLRSGIARFIITPPFFNCLNPSWLDQDTIVFQAIDTSSPKADWDIYKTGIISGLTTQLTSNTEFDINPSCWNGWVTFITNRDLTSNIYVMDGNGGNLERVTAGVDVSDIHYNDGRVYFAHRVNWNIQDIWSCDVPNPTVTYQAHTAGAFDRYPCFVDGELYFSRGTAFVVGYELMRKDLLTGQEVQITSRGRESLDPDYFIKK